MCKLKLFSLFSNFLVIKYFAEQCIKKCVQGHNTACGVIALHVVRLDLIPSTPYVTLCSSKSVLCSVLDSLSTELGIILEYCWVWSQNNKKGKIKFNKNLINKYCVFKLTFQKDWVILNMSRILPLTLNDSYQNRLSFLNNALNFLKEVFVLLWFISPYYILYLDLNILVETI